MQHLFALFYVSAAGSVHRFLDDDVLKDVLGQLPPGEFLFTKGTLRANEGQLLVPHQSNALQRWCVKGKGVFSHSPVCSQLN